MSKGFLGVDPGLGGGFSVYTSHNKVCHTYKMPNTTRDILDLLQKIQTSFKQIEMCCLEKLTGYKQGSKASLPSVFKLGTNYGNLQMALIALEIPYLEVHPLLWQRRVGVSTRKKKETDSKWKGRIKEVAQKLLPKTIGDGCILQTCDAMLLSYFCWLDHSQELRSGVT